MKKLSILAAMLAALSCFTFSACGGGGTTPSVTPSTQPSVEPSVEPTESAGAFTYALEGDGCVLIDYLGEDEDLILPATYLDFPVIAVYCGVFQGNTALKSIVLPETLQRIDVDAFRDCTSLQSVTFSSAPELQIIDDNAFDGCTALTVVEGTATCEKIGSRAFKNCTLLEEINLSSVNEIGYSAFEGCTSLKKVFAEYRELTPEEELEQYEINGCVYTTKKIVVSTGIGTKAFYGCTALAEVYLPRASVGFIGESAFEGCTSLQKIYLPNTVRSIYKNAFKNCNALTAVFYEWGGWTFEEIVIDESAGLENATIYYYSKTEYSYGNYWYHDYNNFGKPTPWVA